MPKPLSSIMKIIWIVFPQRLHNCPPTASRNTKSTLPSFGWKVYKADFRNAFLQTDNVKWQVSSNVFVILKFSQIHNVFLILFHVLFLTSIRCELVLIVCQLVENMKLVNIGTKSNSSIHFFNEQFELKTMESGRGICTYLKSIWLKKKFWYSLLILV